MSLEQTTNNEKVLLPSSKDDIAEPGVMQEPHPSDDGTTSAQLLSTVVGERIDAPELESALRENLLSMNSNVVSVQTTESSLGEDVTDSAQSLKSVVAYELDSSTSQPKQELPVLGNDRPSESRSTENLPAQDDSVPIRSLSVINIQSNPAGSLAVDPLQGNISFNGESVDEKLTRCNDTHEHEILQNLSNPLHKDACSIEPQPNGGENDVCTKVESELIRDATENSDKAQMYTTLPHEEGAKTECADPDHIQKSPSHATDHERLSQPQIQSHITSAKTPTEAEKINVDAEFELDSSPIASSSSSDTSTDSSSSEDSNAEEYEMLDPAEQARLLMQEDAGSDDDGGEKPSSWVPVRTINETPDVIVPKPNLTITKDMTITELGSVENLVENLVLIKARTSGEYQVLEYGSVLCLRNRSVIGVIAETLGRVQQPYYSVRFTNAAAISELGISPGIVVFFVDQHSTPVFTQSLKAFKGSDASNLFDEEVGEAEVEFSDDEAEAEHKRKRKHTSNFHPRYDDYRIQKQSQDRSSCDTSTTNQNIKIEDVELYTPLARPSNLHEIMGNNEAPEEAPNTHHNAGRGRGRGTAHKKRGRPRGSGSRGRGQRGRGSQDDIVDVVGSGRIEKTYENRINLKNKHDGQSAPDRCKGIEPKIENILSNHDFRRSKERSILHSPETSVPSLLEPSTPTMGPAINIPSQFSRHPVSSGQSFRPQNDLHHRYQAQQQYLTPQYNSFHQGDPRSGPYQAQFRGPPPANINIPPGAFVNPAFFPSGTPSPNPQRYWPLDPRSHIQQPAHDPYRQSPSRSSSVDHGQIHMHGHSPAPFRIAQVDIARQGVPTFLPATFDIAQQKLDQPIHVTQGHAPPGSRSEATLRAAQDLLDIQKPTA